METKKNFWIQKVSHEFERSHYLLEKNELSIGFSAIARNIIEDNIDISLLDWKSFERIYRKTYNQKNWRNRHVLWKFLKSYKCGDYILVPQFPKPKHFSVFRVIGEIPEVITELIGVDLGFKWKVQIVKLEIPTSLYAKNALRARLGNQQAIVQGNDLESEVEYALSSKPIDLSSEIRSVATNLVLEKIMENTSPQKFEKLIKWYFSKLGATSTQILPKRPKGKKGDEDADIIAIFDHLNLVIFTQAKFYTGKVNDKKAIDQLYKYIYEKAVDYSEYSIQGWIICSASEKENDKYLETLNSEFEIKQQELFSDKSIFVVYRLVLGEEFANSLLEYGIQGLSL